MNKHFLIFLLVCFGLFLSFEGFGQEPRIFETGKLEAFDRSTFDNFGESMDIDGNYAVFGDSDNNKAYVFEKKDGVWDKIQELKPFDDTKNKFGRSVAISGNYIVIGTHQDFDNGWESGAVYIFKKEGTEWVSTNQKLRGSEPLNRFGWSLDLQDDILVVGSSGHKVEAYIFRLMNEEVNGIDTLRPTTANIVFGTNVAISENFIAVSAARDNDKGLSSGAVYIFEETNGNWEESAKIVPTTIESGDGFGSNMDFHSGILAVSTSAPPMKAYVFENDGQIWNEHQLSVDFGNNQNYIRDISVYNDVVALTIPFTGLVYSKEINSWSESIRTQTSYIYDNILLHDDALFLTNSIGAFSNQIHYYNNFLSIPPDELGIQQVLTSYGKPENDYFGNVIDIHGTFMVVGASKYDNNRGIVYTYKRNDDNSWSNLSAIKPLNGNRLDQLGHAIAQSENYLAVSSIGKNDYAGEVAIYARSGDGWLLKTVLSSDTRSSGDYFGNALAINEDYLIIGAPSNPPISVNDNFDYQYANGQNAGAIYVYKIDNGAFSFIKKIDNPSGNIGDYFGYDVAISDTTIVIGAPGANNKAGKVKVYEIDQNQVTNPIAYLRDLDIPADEIISGSQFGFSVDIDKDFILVGAPQNQTFLSNQGKAYLFQAGNGIWTYKEPLSGSNSKLGDCFGWSVTIENSLAVIGANLNDTIASDGGCAYIFKNNGNNWVEEKIIVDDEATANNQFGVAVNLYKSTDTDFAVGASHAKNTEGLAYAYHRECICPNSNQIDETSPIINFNPERYWNPINNSQFIEKGDTLLVKEECFDIATAFIESDVIIEDNCLTQINISFENFQQPDLESSDFEDFYLDKEARVIWTVIDDCGNKSIKHLFVKTISNNCAQLTCQQFDAFEHLVNHATTNCQNGSSTTKFKRKKRSRIRSNITAESRTSSRLSQNNNPICNFEGDIICDNNNDYYHKVIIQLLSCEEMNHPILQFCEDSSSKIGDCGEVFSDNGGLNNNYGSNESLTWTLCPDNIQVTKIEVSFSSFAVEENPNGGCKDILYIYDGNSISSGYIGGFCGDSIEDLPDNGKIRATNPTGCLTFKFQSDADGELAGWVSNVTCINPSTDINSANECKQEQEKLTAFQTNAYKDFSPQVTLDSYNDFLILGDYTNEKVSIFQKKGLQWEKTQEIVSPDGILGNRFGVDVAISNNYLVIGAGSDSENGSHSGAVYIYEKQHHNGNFQFKKKLKGEFRGNEFGESIALNEEFLVIAAGGAGNTNSLVRGAIYIYEFVNEDWQLFQKLPATTELQRSGYKKVSISENFILIGNRYFQGNIGAIHTYVWNGLLWETGEDILPPNLEVGNYFGWYLSLDNNRLVTANKESREAFVFDWNGVEWVGEQLNLDPSVLNGVSSIALQEDFVSYAYIDKVYIHGYDGYNWVEFAQTDEGIPYSFHGIGHFMKDNFVFYHLYDRNTKTFVVRVYEIPQSSISEDLKVYQTLYASGSSKKDYMGRSVSIDSNYIAIGAGSYDNNRGAVYTYQQTTDNTWEEMSQIVLPNGNQLDQLGRAVAISDGTLAASCMGYKDKEYAGIIYTYEVVDGDWVTADTIDPTINGGENWDYFGLSIAMEGDYMVVGAPTPRSHPDTHHDDHAYGSMEGKKSGTVYIYKKTGNQWAFMTKFQAVPANGEIGDNFGYSVDISNDHIVVGAPYKNNNFGAAYIYGYTDNGDTIIVNEVKEIEGIGFNDLTGLSVAIAENHCIIGVPQDTLGHNGMARIYQKDGNIWEYDTTIYSKDGLEGDRFGWSVAIADSIAVVGATLSNQKGFNSGSAYIFQLTDEGWEQKEVIVASDGILEEQFGTAIAIQKRDSVEIVIGASHALDTRGAAYLYSFQEDCVEDIAPPLVDNCATTFFDSGRDVSDYTSGENTEWTFCPDNPTTENVHISFNSFEVESRNSGGCWDSLTVFNGADTMSTIIGSFCGTSLADAPGGSSITANNDSGCLTFRFRSDGSITKEGWIADVSCVEKPSGDCNKVFLDTGGDTGNYNINEDTTWTFCPNNPETEKIELVFSEFDLEQAGGEECFDYMEFFNGTDATTESFGQFCGTTITDLPNNGVITANNESGCLTVRFKSDGSVNRNGWMAAINCIDKGVITPPTDCGKHFSDSGGRNERYSNNENLSYTLCPDDPQTEKVEIVFSEFDVESNSSGGCYDYLEVFNGDSDAAESFGQFCGGSPDDAPGGGMITAANSSGCLTFKFYSDALFERPGWFATINCIDINQGLSDCEQDSVHVNLIEESIIRQAKEHLTSDAEIVANMNVTYKANHTIILYAGFHAHANSTFLATIEPCPTNIIKTGNDIRVKTIPTKENIQLSARPNPFNAQTTIEYFLPETSTVTINVFDILGREVAVLEQSITQSEGHHSINFESNQLKVGAYFIILRADDNIKTLKLVHIE